MKPRHFIFKCIIVIFVLIIIDFLFGRIFSHAQKNFSKTQYVIEELDTDLLLFGASSIARDIIPGYLSDSLHLSVYNGGSPGNYFLYQNCVIDLMLKHNRTLPKYIVWDVECSYLAGLPKEIAYGGIKDLAPYYGDEYCNSILDPTVWTFLFNFNMYKYNNRVILLIRSILRKDDIKLTDGYCPLSLPEGPSPSKDFSILESKIDSDNVKILEDTVNKLKEKGINLIFITTPVFDNGQRFSTEQYKELQYLANKHNIPFIGAENCHLFDNDSTFFYDNHHLLDKGAKIYTEYLAPILKDYIYASK